MRCYCIQEGVSGALNSNANVTLFLIWVPIVIVASLVPVFITNGSVLLLVALALSFVGLTSAFNLVAGFLGYLPFGYLAMFAVGNLITAIAITSGMTLHIALLLAILAGMAISAFYGLLTLRLNRSYFSISTFVFVFILQYATARITATYNVSYVALPPAQGYSLQYFYWGELSLAIATVLLVYGILRSRLGLAVISIREDEVAARVRGVKASRFKLAIMTISGLTPALSGSLYALYFLFSSVDSAFDFSVMMQILLTTLVGGMGTIYGPILASCILTPFYHYYTQPYVAAIVYALIVLVITLVKPSGFAGILESLWLFRRDLPRNRASK